MGFVALRKLKIDDRVLQVGDPVSGFSRRDLDRMTLTGLVKRVQPKKGPYHYKVLRHCLVGNRPFAPGDTMIGVKRHILDALLRLGRIERHPQSTRKK